MENIFKLSSFNATVVGCGSSLLMYALLMNNKISVNVIYPMIEKVGKTFRSDQWKDSFEKINNKKNENMEISNFFKDKSILITGGTGSLGKS